MEKTWAPTTAGILSIIAGALGVLGGLIFGVIASVFLATANYSGPGDQFIPVASVWLIFLPYVVLCVVAVVGGIYALKRRIWGLALAGAICAVLTVWAWPLGVAAIVFLVISKDEFNHIHPVPPPVTPQQPLLK